MDAATELSLPWFGHAIVSEGRRRRRGHSAQVDVCTVFYCRSKSYKIFSVSEHALNHATTSTVSTVADLSAT